MNDASFWEKVHAAAKKATWASAKARQIERNPKVELFYQIGSDFVHLTVSGEARFVDDLAEKKRVWDAKIFDYELAQFWPEGPGAKDFGLILVTPRRVELTSLPAMTQGQKPEVWRG